MENILNWGLSIFNLLNFDLISSKERGRPQSFRSQAHKNLECLTAPLTYFYIYLIFLPLKKLMKFPTILAFEFLILLKQSLLLIALFDFIKNSLQFHNQIIFNTSFIMFINLFHIKLEAQKLNQKSLDPWTFKIIVYLERLLLSF